ncbi:unnamed protein product [Rotaria sordida]|uniref:C2 domain-containing protein n=2 Tax=Rotaria sordida TaxID=392033 RepID=A0A814LK81_9BILA|nr:unnamed protein product [Rotaria sordida]
MTVNFCEICLAVTICSIITILFYVASWLTDEEKNEEEKSKEFDTSNMQGLDNDEPIPRGEPNEVLSYDSETHIITPEHQPSGEIVHETSDLCRLQDEDLRTRIAKHGSFISNEPNDYVKVEHQNVVFPYDPVVHADSKPSRLHLSIRYDNERSKLIVQIVDAQGLISPEQLFSPEMDLKFTLIGPFNNEDITEKHTRIFVDNARIVWKEPMTFCITFENATKHNLYVYASNTTDPAAPQDREVSIPLNNLDSQGGEINEWYDLQYVQSSY